MGRKELIEVLKNGVFNTIKNRAMSIEFDNLNSVDRDMVELKELLKIKNYFTRIGFKYYDKQLFIIVNYYTYFNNINIDVNEVDKKIKQFIPPFLSNKLGIVSNSECSCDSIRLEKEFDGFSIEKSMNFIYKIPFDLTLAKNFEKVEEIVYKIKENDSYYIKIIKNNKYFLNLYIKEEKFGKTKSIDIKAKKLDKNIEMDIFIMKDNKNIRGEISNCKGGTYYNFWGNKSEESITKIINDNFIKDILYFLELKTIIENDYKLKELIKLIETRIEEIELLHLLLSS